MTPTLVSNNSLNCVATCSTKTILRYNFFYTSPEESANLKAGSAAHEALAIYFRGGTTKESLRAFRKAYKAWALENIDPADKYLARLSYQNVRLILKYWMERTPLDAFPFTVEPEHVEVKFLYPLTKSGDLVMQGILDAGPVRARQGGAVGVLDHKAQPVWSKVLTPHGWRAFGSLSVGDEVVGVNGAPTKVVGVFPQGELPTYRVSFSDGAVTHCAADHLWTVYSSSEKSRGWRTLRLDQIMKRPTDFAIPVSGPIQFEADDELPVEPYVLGEVTKAGKQAVSLMCPHHRCFIPPLYLRASVEARTAILQGLLDTDGNVYNGHVSFTTVSRRMAKDVVYLVRSLGGLARYRLSQGTKQQAYKVSIRLPAATLPFRLPRKRGAIVVKGRRAILRFFEKIEAVEPAEMRCIQVESPDGLYVTDDFIVTHNTTYQINAAWIEAFRLDSQITGYIWGLGQHITESVESGYINALEFSKLPGLEDPGRKCRDPQHGGVTYEECQPLHVKAMVVGPIGRTRHAVAQWKRDAIRLGRRLEALKQDYADLDALPKAPMEGTFTGSCRFCEFRQFCQTGRQLENLDRMLAIDEERKGKAGAA
jgi:hypothetical protein